MNDSLVFGYGSLVSPVSMARTLGRAVTESTDRTRAVLSGYGRRWNYGSLHLRANWHHAGSDVRHGLVVSLGLVEAPEETCNGVMVRVSEQELELLDWRERDYDRVDVTQHVLGEVDEHGWRSSSSVVTYVPRPSAVHRYQEARDAGRAAIRREYVELVRRAFDGLGPHQLTRFDDSTPPPDVPVIDLDVLDTTRPATASEAIALAVDEEVTDPPPAGVELRPTDARRG